MSKSAVIRISGNNLIDEIPLKKLSLFFENVCIYDFSLEMMKVGIQYSGKLSHQEKLRNVSEIEWLIENGIIKPYSIEPGEFKIGEYDEFLAEDMREVGKRIGKNIIRENNGIEVREQKKKPSSKLQYVGVLQATNELIFETEDIGLRVEALRLSLTDITTQFVPILNSFSSYKRKDSSDLALHFILNKIPVPDENTSWEELTDFRNDNEVKRKLYALIDWINEMTRSNLPIAHIIDKYNYLYSEYAKQYSLHKLNSGFTTIELLIISGVEFINSLSHQNYISAIKGLINIRKQQVELMKAEKKIQGRELAYIHSVNERFS